MRFKTKIEFRDYLNLMYLLSYRKPAIIFILIMGFGFLGYSTFFTQPSDEMPWIELLIGLYLIILIPFAIYRTSKRNFYSNKRIQETIEYEFDDDKMKVIGESFSSELGLDKTYKIEELKKWFLVFQSKPSANLIPKENLSENEIDALREIFRKQKNTKLKLK